MKNWLWLIRLVVFALVVFGVSWQFQRILSSEALTKSNPGQGPIEILWHFALKLGSIKTLSAVLIYILGIGCSFGFWHICVQKLGDKMSLRRGALAFYYSQWGKYAPGKGLALLMRVGGAVKAGASVPIAAVASVFEVLVTMVSGALLGLLIGLVFAWFAPNDNPTTILFHAVIILGVAIIPVLPPIFDRLVFRMAKRFLSPHHKFTKPDWGDLGKGILLTSGNWLLLGASLWVLVSGFDVRGLDGISGWLRCVMFVCLANVGGFIASTPGGLGVREYLLEQYLEPFLGAQSVVVVLLLRLLWTLAEVLAVGPLWIVSGQNRKTPLMELSAREGIDAATQHSGAGIQRRGEP